MGRGVRSAGVALAVLVGTALAGCGAEEAVAEKVAEEGMEAAAGAESSGDVDVDLEGGEDGEMRIETEEGSMVVGSQEIPEGFPDDVPLPDADYEVASAMEVSTEGGFVQVQLIVADGDVEALAGHLESGLTDAGYTIGEDTRQSMAEMQMARLQFSGNGNQGHVVVREDPNTADGSSVVYHVGEADQQQDQ